MKTAISGSGNFWRPSLFALALAVGGLTLAPGAEAAEFCVSTGNQLQNALDAADGNDQDDVIKVVSGTHITNITAPTDYHWRFWYTNVDADNNLVVSGGWSAGNNCATQSSLDPASTVLDAENLGPVFNIQPYGSGITLSGDITISNLTFARGRGQAFGGIGYPAGVRVHVPEATGSTSLVFDNILVTSASSAADSVSISGFYIGGAGFLRLRNSIFHGNTLTHAGTTGIFVRTSGNAVAYVNNNSVYENTTVFSHPGFIGSGVVTFSNNAVADNVSSSVPANQTRQFYAQDPNSIRLYHNHFQTMGWGPGFPDEFVDQTSGDAHWTQVGSRMVPNTVSPLRNSGVNAPSGGVPGIDFSGGTRTINGTIDRGAVEGAFIADIGPEVTASIPVNVSTTVLIGATGEVLRTYLHFNVTGGNGLGQTSISCYSDSNNSIAVVESPSFQYVGVGGTAIAVPVRMTIGTQTRTDLVRCNFDRENEEFSQATYFFEARVGVNTILSDGFED